MRIVGVLAVAAILWGCGPNAAPVQNNQVTETESKPIDGYGKFKFGLSFKEVIGATDTQFNPYYLRLCFKNLPINGCTLVSKSEVVPFEMREGIPYGLELDLNKLDRLTDVTLKYKREKGISGPECRSIHERTLDWLTKDYGKFYSPLDDNTLKEFRTSAGNRYLSQLPNKEGNWITQSARTLSGEPSPAVLKKPMPIWDDRPNVTLFSTFIIGQCTVDATFRDRRSVARQDLDRALSLASEEMEDARDDAGE